jgi:O-antigen/teichoic acid export membrane protein
MSKYLKAISYNLIFFVINALAFIILTPLAIRIMGGEFYGLWTIIFAIMQFTNIGTLGIGSIVNKFAAEQDNPDFDIGNIISSALIIILPMAILTASILFVGKNIITSYLNLSITYTEQFNQALTICSISIIPQYLNKVFQGYFLSQIMNKFVRSLDFVSNVFPWMGGIIIAILEKNLIWMAILNLAIQIGIAILYSTILFRKIRKPSAPSYPTIKRMLSFSLFMFLESSAITLFQQFDRILVGFTQGPIIAGVYSVGTSIGLRLSIITGQATEVMIPYASLKDSKGDQLRLYTTFRNLSRYLSLFLAVISSVAIIWMHEILSLWISPDYADHYAGAFKILILAYNILSLSRSGHQTLTGMGKVKFTSLVYLFSSIFMLVSLYFLSRHFGLSGAASANLLMVFLLLFNLFVYKSLNKQVRWRHVVEDLGWGIFLPIFIFLFALVFPFTSIPEKIFLSLVICVSFLIVMARDINLKNRLWLISQAVLKV